MLTNTSDNLITEVSEGFKEYDFCRLPAEHLPSLERDFQIVIAGIESLLILLSRLQPQFDDLITEFVEKHKCLDYADRSLHCVGAELFALTREQISAKAWVSLDTEEVCSRITVVQKKESILQQLAFKIGQAVKPQDLASILREGGLIQFDVSGGLSVLLKRLLGRIEVKTDMLVRFKELLFSRSKQIVDRSESTRALGRFLVELLTEEQSAFEKARQAYCKGLRPITQFDVPWHELKTKTTEAILRDMIRDRIIRIRFTPAVRTDKRTTEYFLSPETVNIRLNGYSCVEADQLFTVRPVDVQGDVLHYEIHLNRIPAPVLHIFADVNDCRGEHSQYIDCQLKSSC